MAQVYPNDPDELVTLADVWESNLKPCGPFVFPAKSFRPLLTFVLMTIPFMCYLLSYDFREIEPGLIGQALPLICYILMIVFALLTVFTEPGVMPRYKSIYADRIYSKIPNRLFYEKEVMLVSGSESIQFRFCSTCNFYRSVRGSHCRTCDCCINVQDHHCPWLNVCIGRRNYLYFFVFVLLMVVGMVVLLSLSCANIQMITQQPFLVATIVCCVLPSIPVIHLFVLHMYLVFTKQTTREYFKRKRAISSPSYMVINRDLHKWLCYAPQSLLKLGRRIKLRDRIKKKSRQGTASEHQSKEKISFSQMKSLSVNNMSLSVVSIHVSQLQHHSSAALNVSQEQMIPFENQFEFELPQSTTQVMETQQPRNPRDRFTQQKIIGILPPINERVLYQSKSSGPSKAICHEQSQEQLQFQVFGLSEKIKEL